MRILVTGSREWTDEDAIWEHLCGPYLGDPDSFLLVGDCPTGLDDLAELNWSANGGLYKVFYADWDKHGRAAGPKRNAEMVAFGADLCIAFLKKGAANKGTRNCMKLAAEAGIPVEEVWR